MSNVAPALQTLNAHEWLIKVIINEDSSIVHEHQRERDTAAQTPPKPVQLLCRNHTPQLMSRHPSISLDPLR